MGHPAVGLDGYIPSVGSQTARSKRKKAGERQRRAAGPDRVASDWLREQPVWAAVGHLARAVVGAASPEEALERARELLASAVDSLVEAMSPFDVLDVIELIHQVNTTPGAAGGPGSAAEGQASLIELAAVVGATRGHRDGSSPTGADGVRPDPTPAITGIQAQLQACLHLGTLVILLTSPELPGPLARIRFASMMREVYVRNAAYPHMVGDTLVGLFSATAMEAVCRAAMGFTPAEAAKVLEHCAQVRQEGQRRRRARLQAALSASGFDFSAARPEDVVPDHGPPTEALRAEAGAAFIGLWQNASDVAETTVDVLADACQMDTSTVRLIVDAFAHPLTEADPIEAVLLCSSAASPLRLHPLIQDDRGRVMLVHEAMPPATIREVVEQSLKSTPGWSGYDKHRAAYVEDTAAALLAAHLPGADIRTNFEHMVSNPRAARPETRPTEFTTVVECDGLLVLDDIAIILEVKAGAITPAARAGTTTRLRGDLVKIITGAAEQAARVRDRITADRGLLLRDRTWWDLDHVREVHIVAVSLEDLSGVATATALLADAGLLPGGDLPWTVSLHDLRVISELIARPAELIVYLRRRTNLETTRKYAAVDELDLFLEFYRVGLYVEPDPEQVARELPQLGTPRVGARRRRADEHPVHLLSLTDPLDAWYAYQLQIGPPVPRPEFNANPDLVVLVDQLSKAGRPGWLAIGALLLEGSEKTAAQYVAATDQVSRQVRRDGHHHTVCYIGGASRLGSHALIWGSFPTSTTAAQARQHLYDYVTAKKHQLQLTRGIAFVIDPRTGSCIDTVYDNRRPGPDDELATLGRMRLKEPARMPRSAPPPNSRTAPRRKPTIS